MNNILDLIPTVVSKVIQWIDNIFGYFSFYSTRYSKLVLFGFLGLILAKFFKGKVNLDLGANVGKKK